MLELCMGGEMGALKASFFKSAPPTIRSSQQALHAEVERRAATGMRGASAANKLMARGITSSASSIGNPGHISREFSRLDALPFEARMAALRSMDAPTRLEYMN